MSNHPIQLTPISKDFVFLDVLPRDFTITTRNGSCKFNTCLLRKTSNTMQKIIAQNQNNMQYDLDIEDKNNVLSKFEKIYQGEFVEFDNSDFKISQTISSRLNLIGFPKLNNFVYESKASKWGKPQNIGFSKNSSIFNKGNFGSNSGNLNFFFNKEKLGFNKENSSSQTSNNTFISNGFFTWNNCSVKLDLNYNNLIGNIDTLFTIKTKKNTYNCKITGVVFSSVIRDYLSTKPDNLNYDFDYEDENGEFKSISDLFNHKCVFLSNTNVYSIKEISEKLGIESIQKDVDSMINLVEKVSNSIDDQQNVIDSVTDLFDLLFHIKDKKVDYVSKFIEDSKWSQSQKDVYEMGSIIIHVILTNSQLHEYIIDLIMKLDECGSNLKLLMPYIIKRSFQILKIRKMFESESSFIFSFVYLLYKRGLIPKDKLISEFGNYGFSNHLFVSWFLPEICESNENIKIDFSNSNLIVKQKRNFNTSNETKHFYSSNSKNINEYKIMRDKGEYDDEIARALRNDDVDTFQSIVSKSVEQLIKKKVKKNMFEPWFSDDVRYLNYAAAYGSIKCFKYLLLNNEKITNLTFEMSIIGGNNELIRIVDNERSQPKPDTNNNNNTSFTSANEDEKSLINAIIKTIKLHRNDLFDWLIDKNINKINNNQMTNLINASIENGNIHSFVHLIDNGFEFYDCQNSYSQFLRVVTEKNFYYFALFIVNLINFNIESKTALEILIYCILIESQDTLFTIIDKINSVCPFDSKMLSQLIENRHRADKTKAYKKIAQIAFNNNPSNDFTSSFISAIEHNMKELVEDFIEKKYEKKDENIAIKVSSMGSINSEIFVLLLNHINPDFKDRMLRCIDDAVKKKNKPLLEILIKENAPINNALIYSVYTHDIEIVNMILNKNSEPSYVNKLSNNGTALYIATTKNDSVIIKRLLSIPGIDPSLYHERFMTPLIYSATQLNVEVFNLIYDFYGENIKHQKWQLNFAMQNIIDSYSNNNSSNPNELKNIKIILLKIAQSKVINPNKKFLYKSNSKGITPFIYACQINAIEVVKLFIELNKADVNIYNPETGDSPLLFSIRKKFNEISKMLIENPKTNINFENFNGENALSIAISLHQNELINLILKSKNFDPIKCQISKVFFNNNLKQLLLFQSLDVNYIPISNNLSYFDSNDKKVIKTPLINSIVTNDSILFDLIVKHSSFNPTESQLIDASYIAFIQNRTEIFPKVFKLLEKFNIDINSPVFNDNNLLFESIKKNLSENKISEVLNFPKFDSKKSDIVNAFILVFSSLSTNDKDKKFQGNISSTFMKTSILDLLYNFDVDHDHLINLKEEKEGSSLLSTLYKTIFIDGGIDPNQRYNDIYPLENAIQNKLDVLSLCLIDSQKVDFSVSVHKSSETVYHGFGKKADKPQNKSNYLELIIDSNRVKILKEVLSQHLCDINIVNDDDETPLMVACNKNRIECVKILFQMDDLNFLYRNSKGKDALQIVRDIIDKKSQSSSYKFDKKIEVNKINDKEEYLNEVVELLELIEKINEHDKNEQKKNRENSLSNGWGNSAKEKDKKSKYEVFLKTYQSENEKSKQDIMQSMNIDKQNTINDNESSNESNKKELSNNEKDSSLELNQTKLSNNEKDSSLELNKKEISKNEKDSSLKLNKKEISKNEKDSSLESNKTELSSLKTQKPDESSSSIQKRQIESESFNESNKANSIESLNQVKAKIKPEISPLVSFQIVGNDSQEPQARTIKESFREKLSLDFELSKKNQQKPPQSTTTTTIRPIKKNLFERTHRKLDLHSDEDEDDDDYENFRIPRTRRTHRSSHSSKARRSRRSHESSFIDEDENENDESIQFTQQMQNQFLLLHQQQQQWLQMIQMNNQLQAQISFQMMNQAQLNQQKQKQTKKKKKVNNF